MTWVCTVPHTWPPPPDVIGLFSGIAAMLGHYLLNWLNKELPDVVADQTQTVVITPSPTVMVTPTPTPVPTVVPVSPTVAPNSPFGPHHNMPTQIGG